MSLTGKGFMIWKIRDCEGGSPETIASVAQAAGLQHVHIKVAEETKAYNVDPNTGVDLVPSVVKALQARGIQVWGWHYVYGYDPAGEAQIAIRRVKQLGLDGYDIDAEVEYKQSGKEEAARTYMNALRQGLPNTPIALCSFRFPSYHPQFPWKVFLEKCDLNMPQVYWEQAHNPGAQLKASIKEFQAMSPIRPIIPVGPVYKNEGWSATADEITEFMKTAEDQNLKALSFFSWEYGRTTLKTLWSAVSSYQWGGQAAVDPLITQYFTALNKHSASQVVSMFTADGVHITSASTVQGTSALQKWYTTFLTETFPNAKFIISAATGSGNSIHVTWTATSSAGKIRSGIDTFGILNGKITYLYSNYKITQ